MNLKIEAKRLSFKLGQSNMFMHPLTCGGGGGKCSGVNLDVRQVGDTDQLEAYCSNCNEHTQFVGDYESDDYQLIYDVLLRVHRDGKIENIINK